MSILDCHPIPDSDFATAVCDCGKLRMVWFELRIAPHQARILGYDKCVSPRIDQGRAVLLFFGKTYPADNDSTCLSDAVCFECRTKTRTDWERSHQRGPDVARQPTVRQMVNMIEEGD